MIRLASESSPVEIAWAAFDAAAITLNRMYAEVRPESDTPADREARMALAMEVASRWDEFRRLFVGDDLDPRPAA